MAIAPRPLSSSLSPVATSAAESSNALTTEENLFLWMGSARHQLGVYEVLPKLQHLIRDCDLKDKIELKGLFWLKLCSHGIVMKFHDTFVTNISPQNVEAEFNQEILPAIHNTWAEV